MIALIRSCKPREFIILIPVEIAAVNDASAYCRSVTFHIFCGRVSYYVCAEFKWTAVYGSGESVVNYKRNSVRMCDFCELLNVQYIKRRIRYCFAEHRLCVVAEGCVYFLFTRSRVNKCNVNTDFTHSHV